MNNFTTASAGRSTAMDDEYRRALLERVKPRFHGQETVQSRDSWNRPDAAERDYKRLTRETDALMEGT